MSFQAPPPGPELDVSTSKILIEDIGIGLELARSGGLWGESC